MVKVREVMSTNVITIDGEKTVRDACRIMGAKHIGSIIVTVEGKPYGIFTERDLLSKFRVYLKCEDMRKTSVRDFTSAPLVTVGPDTDIKEAAKIMAELHIRRLAVIEDDELVGIFTAADLVDGICKDPLGL